jgi:polyisoprenoid-binding protein YceI
MERQTETAAARSTEASRFDRAAPTPADGVYVLDAGRSSLGFRAKAFCLKWVTGTLRPTSGQVIIDDGIARGHGTADAAAVDTRLKPRDWHLRTSHYLHTTKYPRCASMSNCVISTRGRPRRDSRFATASRRFRSPSTRSKRSATNCG